MRYLLFILLFFSSCYTERKATLQVAKAQALQPDVVAKACASLFPVKTKTLIEKEYIKGKTDTINNRVVIDCDSVIKNNTIVKIRTNKVPCPPQGVRVDTFRTKQVDTIENTAKIDLLNSKLRKQEIEIENYRTRVKAKNRNIRIAYSIVAFLIGFIGINIYLKFRKW